MIRHPAAAIALILMAAAVLAAGPLVLPPFYVRVGQLMLYSAALGVAWAILGGFAGYGSFGHAAFIGVGAFTAGLVEERLAGLSAPATLAAGLASGGLACAILSAVVAYPILRLRGAFFAIAMLGVCHVCAELNNNVDALQGSLGLNFPAVAPAGWDPAAFFYELYLVAGLVVLLIAWQIRRSRFGAGLLSIREDEDTARMLGVPTERYKRTALVISAVLTGCLGVIYAHSLGYITTPGLTSAIGQPGDSFCMACFTGDYPMPVPQELDKLGLETPIWLRESEHPGSKADTFHQQQAVAPPAP